MIAVQWRVNTTLQQIYSITTRPLVLSCRHAHMNVKILYVKHIDFVNSHQTHPIPRTHGRAMVCILRGFGRKSTALKRYHTILQKCTYIYNVDITYGMAHTLNITMYAAKYEYQINYNHVMQYLSVIPHLDSCSHRWDWNMQIVNRHWTAAIFSVIWKIGQKIVLLRIIKTSGK